MRTNLIYTFFAFLLFVSCNERTIYSEQKNLPKNGWDKNSSVDFTVEIEDTILAYDMLITLRNNEKYPNQNLWLFVEEVAPDSTIKQDTVQCFLVDNQGYWIGAGVGSLHYTSVFYCQKKLFQQKGIYQYRIKHGMRYDLLEGLNDIGIKIQKTEED